MAAPKKFVLLCFANHANKKQYAWPSANLVAEETGLNIKTVRSAIKGLVNDEYLLIKGVFPETHSRVFWIDESLIDFILEGQEHTSKYGYDCPETDSEKSENGFLPYPDPGNGTYKEPSNELSNSHQSEFDDHADSPKQPRMSCPVAEVIAAYNERFNGLLPRCEAKTAKREKAIKARWADIVRMLKDEGIEPTREAVFDQIHAMFDKVANTPFLMGGNGRDWRANIDFIFRESGFLGILEGKYARV